MGFRWTSCSLFTTCTHIFASTTGSATTKSTVEGFAVSTEWNSNFVLAPPGAVNEENALLGIPNSLSAQEVSAEGGWAPLSCTPFVVSEKESMISTGMMEPSGSLFPSRATTPAAHTLAKVTNAVQAPFDVKDHKLAHLAKGIYSREDRQEMTESRVGTPKSPTDRPKSPPFFLTGVEAPLDGGGGGGNKEKKQVPPMSKSSSMRSTPKEVVPLTLRKKKTGKLGGARRWYSVQAKPSFIIAKPREFWQFLRVVMCDICGAAQVDSFPTLNTQRWTRVCTTACSYHKYSQRPVPRGASKRQRSNQR